MIKLGEYNTLEILRETEPGLYLGDEEENVVLLPHKYKPEEYEIGDEISVFIYLDNEERPIATTLRSFSAIEHFWVFTLQRCNGIWCFYGLGFGKTIVCPF